MLLFGIRSPSVQVLGGSRCAGRCAELLARETLAQTELYYIVVNMVQHTAQPLAASPMPANYWYTSNLCMLATILGSKSIPACLQPILRSPIPTSVLVIVLNVQEAMCTWLVLSKRSTDPHLQGVSWLFGPEWLCPRSSLFFLWKMQRISGDDETVMFSLCTNAMIFVLNSQLEELFFCKASQVSKASIWMD